MEDYTDQASLAAKSMSELDLNGGMFTNSNYQINSHY